MPRGKRKKRVGSIANTLGWVQTPEGDSASHFLEASTCLATQGDDTLFSVETNFYRARSTGRPSGFITEALVWADLFSCTQWKGATSLPSTGWTRQTWEQQRWTLRTHMDAQSKREITARAQRKDTSWRGKNAVRAFQLMLQNILHVSDYTSCTHLFPSHCSVGC